MKYWYGHNKSGEVIREQDTSWEDAQGQLIDFYFNNNGQTIELPKNKEYIQGKTASATMGTGEVQIESRFFGWKKGNNIVKIRIDEKSNSIKIDVE